MWRLGNRAFNEVIFPFYFFPAHIREHLLTCLVSSYTEDVNYCWQAFFLPGQTHQALDCGAVKWGYVSPGVPGHPELVMVVLIRA